MTCGLILLLFLSIAAVCSVDGDNSTECVSQQELAAVKAEVDQLHSQLHYWQNATVNILKDHCSSINTARECGSEVTGDTVLMSIVFNITQNDNTEIKKRLDSLEDLITQRQIVIAQCQDTIGSFLNPADSCNQILLDNPGTTSGYYWLLGSQGRVVKVFCDMERVCGCDEGGGGWMRVADIDMTRPNETCPARFRKVTASGKTMCGGQGRRCISKTFGSHGLQYSRVCGKIIGYQFGRIDAFSSYIMQRLSIDDIFVDGIVLTHGSPRNHIWTFTTGNNQYLTDLYNCPCNGEAYPGPTPPYIGNDYFCDSGYQRNAHPPLSYFTDDPLWDGAGCVSGSCCTFNSPPWFCKNLSTPTTDDIELRLCLNANLSNEDAPFEIVELYIQ